MTKLIGSDGKPLQSTKVNHLVIFKSDDGENWEPKRREDLPESLMDKDVMGYLASGEILESPDGTYYRAENFKYSPEK